jgi:Protein of unknown function (DUF3712)
MSSRPSSPHASERTPLLSRQDEESQISYSGQVNGVVADAAGSLYSNSSTNTKNRRRWPSIITLTLLCVVVLLACFGFAAPSIAQEYAARALVFEPERLSIDSLTSFGVRARIQGDFWLDASRVRSKPVRDLGRLATWIAREAESGKSEVKVHLPEYSDTLLGTAHIPPIKVNIRNNHYNHIDILTDLEPGDVEGIRAVADDFLAGRLKHLNVEAVAQMPLKTGLIKLGIQTISQVLVLKGKDVSEMPNFDVRKLRFGEHGPPGHPDGVKAMATVSMMNPYPINFDVPPLGFEILLPDCFDDYLVLGTAKTDIIQILPKEPISASVTGLIRQLPTSLTTACPGSHNSPLDSIVGDYLAGRNATVYIKGGEQDENTPEWIGRMLRDTTVPFSLPGHSFDNLIKEFSLADVHFSLPNPVARDPHPKISAVVKVLVGLPQEMNVNLDVDRVRADADVFYNGDLMGKLDLRKWQAANATKLGEDMLIQSAVREAPLEITDDAVFSKVVQQLVFGGKGVHLTVKANVDANTATALGQFVVRSIPAKGKIFVKPIGQGGFDYPSISDLKIVETTPEFLTLQATANVTNPTDYSAHVPYVNVSIVVNDTRVGYAWASADVVPGPNEITVQAAWEVSEIGREWLSQFVSGHNTSFTIKTHANSVPSIPDIGLALEVPTPHLFGKFLKEATVR